MGEKVAVGPSGLVTLKEIAIKVARITEAEKDMRVNFDAAMEAYKNERAALQSQCPHPKTQEIADTEHEGFVLSVVQCELCDAYVDKRNGAGVYDPAVTEEDDGA